MHKSLVQQRPARKLLGAIIAAALFLPDTGYTLGLGEIEVNSALNQKLNADIELLSALPEDTETIIIKLASRKEFSRAGLDRPYSLTDLRFKSVLINGLPYIKVTSSSPIKEPFLNFLVEIDWPNGHLLREYTVLLDPPVFMTQTVSAATTTSATNNSGFRPSSNENNSGAPMVAAPGVAASFRPASSNPASVSQPRSGQVNSAAATNQANWVPAPVMRQQVTINQPAGSYKIKSGDTAWSLADAMRPDQSVTVPQMMVAMLRANPESFINENINGLKRGYILRVPDYDQINSVSQTDAMALVREQAALWREYQQAQSGGQPVSAMQAGDAGAASRTSENAAGSASDAYLEIVSAGSGSSTLSGKDPTDMTADELRAELARAREKVETELVAKEALQQRVDSLQQHVEKMKGMLSIDDAELADVQALNAPDENALLAANDAELSVSDEAVIDESVAEENLTDEAMVDESMANEASADAVTDQTETALAETASEDADSLFVDEPLDGEEPAAEMPEQAPAVENTVVQTPIVTQPEEDPLTQLLNNPMMLAAAGGGSLLILALIGLIIKRRKAAAETETVTSGFDDLESLADQIADETDDAEGQEPASAETEQEAASEEDFDSTATVVLDSAEDTVITDSEAADATIDTDEEDRDDVIAEADVYLAYGIYQQAEELLTKALTDNPERDEYRVKLAETHYASKNADAFVDVAAEIKERINDDESVIWKKVLGMGQDLCSDHPMFKGTMVSGLDVASMSTESPEMDFDLGLDDAEDETVDEAANMGDASPEVDTSLDEEPLELPDMDEGAEEPVEELEFDLSDADAVEESNDAEDEFSLDIDASELDIDISENAESLDLTDEVEESLDLTDVDIGLSDEPETNTGDVVEEISDVELDFGLDEESKQSANDDVSDLPDSGLTEAVDEEPAVEDKADDSIDAAPLPEMGMGEDDEDDFDLSSLDDVDEISTKLDLARAYLDMGDHEGTKGILEEVLADGDEEQKREANELMAKLD